MQSFWDVHTHIVSNYKNSIFNVIAGKDNIPDNGFFSIGIHPWHYKESEENSLIEIINKEANNPRCLAIGECGLDKFNGPPLIIQERVFIRQINIAIQQNKPLIIHCVKHYTLLKKIIDGSDFKGTIILHGFNQKLETADLFVQEKYVFSIGKSIFDDKSNSIEILKKYYPNKILFETDDSGVSIEHIYEKASQILNVDKNKINSEVRSKLKTIFAENKI
jgi:TatD DNase family protein